MGMWMHLLSLLKSFYFILLSIAFVTIIIGLLGYVCAYLQAPLLFFSFSTKTHIFLFEIQNSGFKWNKEL